MNNLSHEQIEFLVQHHFARYYSKQELARFLIDRMTTDELTELMAQYGEVAE